MLDKFRRSGQTLRRVLLGAARRGLMASDGASGAVVAESNVGCLSRWGVVVWPGLRRGAAGVELAVLEKGHRFVFAGA